MIDSINLFHYELNYDHWITIENNLLQIITDIILRNASRKTILTFSGKNS